MLLGVLTRIVYRYLFIWMGDIFFFFFYSVI